MEVELTLIATIAAVSSNGVIGNGGGLPWHFFKDLKYFKEVTMGHAVLFGRKTFESIGKPLNGRKIIILTNDSNYRRKGIIIVNKVEILIDNYLSSKDILFVAGGESIFRRFLPVSAEAYITHIEKEFTGDRYFPLDGLLNFSPASVKEELENGVKLRFVKYINNNYDSDPLSFSSGSLGKSK